jgi:phage terminase small subunit
MTNKCKFCKKKFEGSQRKKYCSAKCKKNYENSLRSTPIAKVKKTAKKVFGVPTGIPINRPHGLNNVAAAYWDKIAPTLIHRGHLNVLSEDAFAELCDLYSRLVGINRAIDETNQSLLQLDDKWDNRAGTETQSMKESALSDLKRKYSQRFLDYCKQFYLTPLSNRGDFGLDEEAEKEKDEFFTD